MKSGGFTLVELLVVIGLVGLILLISSEFLRSTNSVSTSSVATSSNITRIQQGANVVADDVRRALYIVPPGASAYVSAVATAVPSTGSPAVTKAGANVLAMYTGKTSSTRCTGATENYEYMLYYFAKRSDVASGSEWSSVQPDPLNQDQLVLMQFSACVTVLDPATAVTSQELLRVVTDYLGAGTFTYAASTTLKYRRVTLSMTPKQVILNRTVTSAATSIVATARNIF